jgi:hypothetical protein
MEVVLKIFRVRELSVPVMDDKGDIRLIQRTMGAVEPTAWPTARTTPATIPRQALGNSARSRYE